MPECSGAEWWTLILECKDNNITRDDDDAEKKHDHDDNDDEDDDDDEVGMHFDADYGLEAQVKNLMIHPRLATVTYLSNVGVPTLVLDQRSPPPSDVTKLTLEGNVDRGWLSAPKIGKHIAFDGRLLHGAPGAFFPAISTTDSQDEHYEHQEKKRKMLAKDSSGNQNSTKRVTFLVNIWLNHCPLDAELLDQYVCDQLRTPWKVQGEPNENHKRDDAPTKGKRKQGNDDDDDDDDVNDNDNDTPVFQWVHNGSPDAVETVALQPSNDKKNEKPAGMEETVICHRHITFAFQSPLDMCKEVAAKVGKDGSSVEIRFEKGALQIIVGEEHDSSEEEEEDGNEEDE